MDELFNILSSSARLDKRKTAKKRICAQELHHEEEEEESPVHSDEDEHDDDDSENSDSDNARTRSKSRDRTGKRDTSEKKRLQVHKEQVAAFRRSMSIRLADKHDPDVPDPISSFQEMMTSSRPSWWSLNDDGDSNGNGSDKFNTHRNNNIYDGIVRAVQRNIEAGKWKEPTPIQMQSIPSLLQRRDFIGAAPTGSGKSGAFIVPALILSSAPHQVFYERLENANLPADSPPQGQKSKKADKKKKKKKKSKKSSTNRTGDDDNNNNNRGRIRVLVLAPSLELAAQLHREVERLGMGKQGGLTSILLSKSNAPQLIDGTAGGKKGIDILVSTPLRLVDSIEKGLHLGAVRMVVLDEADRLLDAADGGNSVHRGTTAESGDDLHRHHHQHSSSSGSTQTRTFLAQMDLILGQVPASAVRALFSATVTPMVREMAESILRNPVDVTIAKPGSIGGANPDIEQELVFTGREEGKILAIRQLVQRGQLRPPTIIFMESQDRAQALFGELLYDGIHVDVIHAGRSKSARGNAVAKFRKGETWVLICTDLVSRGVDFRAVNMVINYDLPASGITYVHRIGRTGRAGRKGKAITLFTESDFDNLRTVANVMKQSGCKVEEWMLNLSRNRRGKKHKSSRRRKHIDTTPGYDKAKKRRKEQIVQHHKEKAKKLNEQTQGKGND